MLLRWILQLWVSLTYWSQLIVSICVLGIVTLFVIRHLSIKKNDKLSCSKNDTLTKLCPDLFQQNGQTRVNSSAESSRVPCPSAQRKQMPELHASYLFLMFQVPHNPNVPRGIHSCCVRSLWTSSTSKTVWGSLLGSEMIIFWQIAAQSE